MLDEEFRRVAQRLPIQRVQHGVAGPVRGGAGALCGRAFAVIGRHAAEGPLIDLAVLGAAERHAVMFEFVHSGGSIAAEIFDGVLVAQPVGPLHGVVHVPAPVVHAHIPERRGDAALRGDGVRPGGKDLCHARGLEPGFGAAERRAKPRAARSHDNDIERVIPDRVGAAVQSGSGDAALPH